MPTTAVDYGIGCACLIIAAVLVRLGPGAAPRASAARGRDLGAVSNWLLAGAGIGALLGVLHLVQRGYGGDPNVYTAIRLTLSAAAFAVLVRLVLLFGQATPDLASAVGYGDPHGFVQRHRD
jgi:hypothetical protein